MWIEYDDVEFSELLGKTLVSVKINECINEKPFETTEAIVFTTDNGTKYVLSHIQACCEQVTLEELIGNLDDLLNSPITLAELVQDDNHSKTDDDESYTWSFYKLATVKGYVTFRFYGESNGYYSETVEFVRLGDK